MDETGGQLSESLAAVRSVFKNPNLRRIELAFAGSAIGAFLIAESGYTTAFSLVAPMFANAP